MRRSPATPLVVVLAALSSACPATVDGTTADAGPPAPDVPVAPDAPDAPDAPVAADAPTGPCRWRAGEAVVLPAVTSAAPHRALLDVRPAEGGAWVLTADDAGGDRQPDVALERIDASGRRRADGVVRFPSGFAPSSASLAVDEPTGRRAILEEVRDISGGTCAITLLDARGNPSARREIAFPGGGFSLAGCRDLLVNSVGFTFLAEQVRALWGASVVQLDPAGATPAQDAPAVLDGFPPVPFSRFGLADRSFVLVTRETLNPQPRLSRLHVRRYDERGAARGETHTLANTLDTLRDSTLVEAGDGLLALWEEAPAATPGAFGVSVRALDADGRPRGEARPAWAPGFYQGGLAAAFAQGDVLAGGIVGSGRLSPVVTPLGPDGTRRGDEVAIPLVAGATRVEALRLVATPTGALAIYTTDPGANPNRLVAVPLVCDR
jgi:hypothetical protein